MMTKEVETMDKDKCIIEGCNKVQYACKLCEEHYLEAFIDNKKNITDRFGI